MMDAQTKLLGLLATHAYQFRPSDPFVLASGERSPEYFDCKQALSQPEAMACLGELMLARLDPSVAAIGGLTMGADPIAMSTAQASAGTRHAVRWFTVRKEAKAHGQKRLVEGDAKPGVRVAIVDDVVTSGKSTIQAISAAREAGLEIVQVIVLVDRQQLNGLGNIRDAAGSAKVEAIFTKTEIKAQWQRQNPTAQLSPTIV